ncbi:delta-like protein 1 [Dermacentor silvarum]|uniref:delta-like protein 1 n=1 Tax=Dermacentor silvarum TaxID=543639 RepID=UPI001896AEF3|nr:delta-like protein 1 [Dermacentor silvarum]
MARLYRCIFLGPVPLLILLTVLAAEPADAASRFELRLRRFVTDGTDARGECCGGLCPGACRVFMRSCLARPRDSTCSMGLLVSPVVANNSMPPGFVLAQNFTSRMPWPGRFRLTIEAWHTQNGTVPPEGAFRRDHRTRRPLVDRFRSLGASEWFLQLASRVLDIPERWIQRRTDDQHNPELGSLVRRFALHEFLAVGVAWQHRSFPGLEVDYRVTCVEGYAGANCSERCPGPNEKVTRFRCLEGGAKQCMDGWAGTECERPVCAEGCDAEHGFCEKPGECLCRMGWEGSRCDRCTPMPGCVHGACNASFECNCLPGWDGFFCNRPMCGQGCHATRGYCEKPGQCSCRFGWQGPKCDECKPLPGCLHGHCTKPLECICDPGWTGIFCHIPVCSPKCHHEHGYCARPNECRCRVGWMGENCSQCCPYPGCRHGSCNKPWECTCEPGWGGMLCDKPLPPACEATDPPPCAEGTTCIDMPDGGFKCACPEGAQASNCTAATSERRRTMLR